MSIVGLEDLCGNENKVFALDALITKLSDKNIFDENQWQDLWRNNRFVIIIRSLIDNSRISGKLLSLGCETSVPSYVPKDIAIKINESRVDNTDMTLPQIIQNFDEFHEILKEMRRRDTIPENFRTVLANSITDNKEFIDRLDYFEITTMFKWNGNIFTEAIEMSCIETIVDKIDEWIQEMEEEKDKQKENIQENHFDADFSDSSKTSEIKLIRKPRSASWVMPKNIVDVFGDKPIIISSKDFIRLNRIIQRPLLSGDNLRETVIQVMPYILQKIKMWGCSALTADSIALLMASISEDNNAKPLVSKRPRFGAKPNTNKGISEQNMKTEAKTPLSRIDTIVGVLNNVNAIVGQDVLNIMAKFPLAIPLIIRSIYEKDKYKVFIEISVIILKIKC